MFYPLNVAAICANLYAECFYNVCELKCAGLPPKDVPLRDAHGIRPVALRMCLNPPEKTAMMG